MIDMLSENMENRLEQHLALACILYCYNSKTLELVNKRNLVLG